VAASQLVWNSRWHESVGRWVMFERSWLQVLPRGEVGRLLEAAGLDGVGIQFGLREASGVSWTM